MQEIVEVPDDIYKQVTEGTPLESKINFMSMLFLCRIDKISYTIDALHMGLRKKFPGIKKETTSLSVATLLKEDYVGIKEGKHIYVTDKGKKIFEDMYKKLLELMGHRFARKKPKLRKSFVQEYHQRPEYARIDPWSFVE